MQLNFFFFLYENLSVRQTFAARFAKKSKASLMLSKRFNKDKYLASDQKTDKDKDSAKTRESQQHLLSKSIEDKDDEI